MKANGNGRGRQIEGKQLYFSISALEDPLSIEHWPQYVQDEYRRVNHIDENRFPEEMLSLSAGHGGFPLINPDLVGIVSNPSGIAMNSAFLADTGRHREAQGAEVSSDDDPLDTQEKFVAYYSAMCPEQFPRSEMAE